MKALRFYRTMRRLDFARGDALRWTLANLAARGAVHRNFSWRALLALAAALGSGGMNGNRWAVLMLWLAMLLMASMLILVAAEIIVRLLHP